MSTSTSRGSAITNVGRDRDIEGEYQHLYEGGFCFHTAKTSFLLPLDEAKRGLAMLAEAGMRKINFSGGEPFLIQGGGEMISSPSPVL